MYLTQAILIAAHSFRMSANPAMIQLNITTTQLRRLVCRLEVALKAQLVRLRHAQVSSLDFLKKELVWILRIESPTANLTNNPLKLRACILV